MRLLRAEENRPSGRTISTAIRIPSAASVTSDEPAYPDT